MRLGSADLRVKRDGVLGLVNATICAEKAARPGHGAIVDKRIIVGAFLPSFGAVKSQPWCAAM